jgi:hypothetical protein
VQTSARVVFKLHSPQDRLYKEKIHRGSSLSGK